MTQTSYVNPNGLPADGQITSARDLAILARAIIRDLPEYEYFVHIPSIRYGRRITQNFNKLIGRYPGADGFKTGFICASGYNLVASATRDGKRLIAVVLGASSGHMRAVRAAQLLERGFANNGLSWLRPSLGTVDNLVPIDASPPNLRDEMCGGKRKRPASDEDDGDRCQQRRRRRQAARASRPSSPPACSRRCQSRPSCWPQAPAPSEPIPVYTGPTSTGAALIAAVAADTEAQAVKPRGRKKTRVAAKKPDAAGQKNEAKSDGSKSDSKHEVEAGEPSRRPPGTPAVKPDAAAQTRGWRLAAHKPAAAKPLPSRSASTSSTAARRRSRAQGGRPNRRTRPSRPVKPGESAPLTPIPLSRLRRSARVPLAIGGRMLNTVKNKAARTEETGSDREGNHHGAHLAQAISGRRARRYRRHPIRVAGRASGRELCEVCRPQGLHLHGQVDQLSRARRDVAGAWRVSAEQGPAKGRARRADDAERAAISGRDRRRAARRLRGRQRQSALHPARARASAEGFRRRSHHRAGEFCRHRREGDGQDRAQARHRRQHGRSARLQGHDRQSRGAAGQEDGAGLCRSRARSPSTTRSPPAAA